MIKNILTTLTQQATTQPDQLAFDYLGQTNTYADLEHRSNSVANYLKTCHLTAKSPVMVYGGQTFDMLVAFIGCVKAGHAYIPVDTNSSTDRLTSIMQTARPELVIAVEPLPIKVTVPVTTNADLNNIYQTLPVNFQPKTALDDTFYIIFTSGTTGNPKGVQITQRNLLSFVNWMSTDFNFMKRDVLLQPPFSFDLSVMALYPTLMNGGTLRVLPQTVTANFSTMFTTLASLPLQIWVSTPSLVDICLLDPYFDQQHYPELSTFLFCGEELTHQTASKLNQRFPQAHIVNTYGPTEATVAMTAVEITPAILQAYDRLPIGYVKPGTQVTIDSASVNEPGEIIIAGFNVSKGYLNNPAKTKAAFFQTNGLQAYCTGDLGYFDHDLLFYKGRVDFQIKLNGYRIELEEVNHFLSEVTLLKQGVAVPKYDQNHKVSQLLAVVVPKSTQQPSQVALRQALAGKLMPYMVPQRFIFRESLPHNVNGKVDIKALISEVNAHA